MVLGKALSNVPHGYRGHPDSIIFYSDFDLKDIGDGSDESHLALRTLAQRAISSNRKVILGVGLTGVPELGVEFPVGQDYRYVFIDSYNYEIYRGFPFEDYEFLPQYDAIWSKNSDIVEAQVDWARLGILKYASPGNDLSNGRVIIDQSSGAEIRFGWPSRAAQALLDITNPDTDIDKAAMTLALVGTHIKSVDEAVTRLESIGNAFLFQISLLEGDLPSLVRIPPAVERPILAVSDRPYRWNVELSFPRRNIQAEPLELYYYAGMLRDDFPLLKFLAYYQVLEYYFVRYSHLDVAQSVRSILAQPGFNSHDVGQVAQIVDHVLARARRRGFGSEREQLRATITKCVEYDSFCAFLTDHRYRGVALREHLANSQVLAGVEGVEVGQSQGKVLQDLANRIYDIRNRIVHAKQSSTDGGQDPLFPFSEESKALQPDIEVMRYVSASVLIESATSPV
jgi:hypothetical protein